MRRLFKKSGLSADVSPILEKWYNWEINRRARRKYLKIFADKNCSRGYLSKASGLRRFPMKVKTKDPYPAIYSSHNENVCVRSDANWNFQFW